MILKAALAGLFLVAAFSATAFAETTVIPLDSSIGLETTVIPFHAPSNSNIPWGYVEGTVTNPVDGHHVIIQFFKNDEPVHFAQTPINDDGTYEYKFRVRDVTDGKVTKIFEGDYIIKIFKVVYLENNTSA
ncbi:MAG: hypothetical protein QXW91_01245 [Candidatus Nitrosotenuis sp.]